MVKEVMANPHWSKTTPDEHRADCERQAIRQTAKPIPRFPPDWATLARQGIHDRRTRTEE
jgi:hypothetical protein